MFTKISTIAAAVLAMFVATTAFADIGHIHKLAIQVSDKDPATMTKVLNVVVNAARDFSSRGEEYDIQVVNFNAGLHMLRSDTSPVAERIAGIAESIPDLTFNACGNTITNMTKKSGKVPPIMAFAKHVPAGIVRLMELDNEGYSIIRP